MIPQLTQDNTPAKKPQLPNNTELGSFIVKARTGFTILGHHKFDVFKRDGLAVPEYCYPCSNARRWIGVEGPDSDYVKSALSKYQPKDSAITTLMDVQREFSELLVNEYQLIRGNS